MVVARQRQGSQVLPDADRHGPLVVARLRAGVPDASRGIDRLDGRWREVADCLASVGATGRADALRTALAEREDGRAMLAAIFAANTADDPLAEPVIETSRQRFALKSVADIKAMPPLRWQIANHIPRGSLVVEFGQSGSGKSFEALEQACSIASDTPWHGLEVVESGIVVYVATEGSGGLNKRIAAWERQHPGADLSRLYFVTEPVNLLDDASVLAFKDVLRSLPEPPAGVFMDTLARCLVGGDENSARDMGLAIAAVDGIRSEFDATVYVIHHTGKNGEAERGSSALRAAADVMIQVVGDDARVTLTCSKMKDAEPFKKLVLRLVPVAGTDSCVLEYDDNRETDELPPKARELLGILDSHFTGDGATSTQWLKAAGLIEPTFYRHRARLVKDGYVTKTGHRHALTHLGRNALGLPPSETEGSEAITIIELSRDSHESNPQAPASPITTITTLKGDSDRRAESGPIVSPGRPSNGVHNAAIDDMEELPWP